MRYLNLLLLYLIVTTSGYAQRSTQKDLTPLSVDFQRVFNDKGWRMDVPLSMGGLTFTKGLTFHRLNGTVHWDDNDYEGIEEVLDPLIIANTAVEDSILYMLLGVYDADEGNQIIDVYRYMCVSARDEIGFPNPGAIAEISPGMRGFCRMVGAFLDTTFNVIQYEKSSIKVYFSGVEPFRYMTVTSEDPHLKDALIPFFESKIKKYNPPIWYSRPMYSCFEFEIGKTDSGFSVELADYQEFLFCYYTPEALYFINPLHTNHFTKTEMSFVYDEKWREEEFLSSPAIKAIISKMNTASIIEALKYFRIKGYEKPFSAGYGIGMMRLE